MLWLGGTDNRGEGQISESLPRLLAAINTKEIFATRLLGEINTGGIFVARLLSTILGLPAINLSRSFLPSSKAAPGVLVIAFQ
jgi:hypothetical protein